MKKHIIIGSIICLATLLIFLAFWGQLPAEVPIHFDSAGNVNSTLPKAVVVFGIPLICSLLNVISGFSLTKKEEKRIFMYYIVPTIAIIVAVVVLVLAL
ncbi:hypothetical protein BN3660_02650 [Eubacteriaceae bacterium CHKCI004]|nr:hypothetical protein BN3660_02650 [Eubacteriaceae bacterium CHKCI004]